MEDFFEETYVLRDDLTLCLVCVWVMTHIRVVFGEIHGRFF